MKFQQSQRCKPGLGGHCNSSNAIAFLGEPLRFEQLASSLLPPLLPKGRQTCRLLHSPCEGLGALAAAWEPSGCKTPSRAGSERFPRAPSKKSLERVVAGSRSEGSLTHGALGSTGAPACCKHLELLQLWGGEPLFSSFFPVSFCFFVKPGGSC